MKFEAVPLSEAKGKILGHNIARTDGQRLLRKGKPLRDEDLELFEEAFELFWRKPAESWDVQWQGLIRCRRPTAPIITPPPLKEEPPPSNESDTVSKEVLTVIEVTRTYSDREIFRHKDFAQKSAEESEAVNERVSHLRWEISKRRTRLTRITCPLQIRGLDLALKNVGELVNDWPQGMRIGESLKYFNFEWGRRVLGRGAIVLIISDGWDRGDVELLNREMARLKRNCHRVIWLNPLLSAGVRAAHTWHPGSSSAYRSFFARA